MKVTVSERSQLCAQYEQIDHSNDVGYTDRTRPFLQRLHPVNQKPLPSFLTTRKLRNQTLLTFSQIPSVSSLPNCSFALSASRSRSSATCLSIRITYCSNTRLSCSRILIAEPYPKSRTTSSNESCF